MPPPEEEENVPFFEDTIVVYGPEPEAPRDLVDFILRGYGVTTPTGGMPGSDGSNKEMDIAANKTEEELDKRTEAAETLLTPPAHFGQCSQELAKDLAEVVKLIRYAGKLLVFGIFTNLATSTPAETLATSGYPPDPGSVQQASLALASLRPMMRSKLRQLITLALTSSNCSMTSEERQYWTNVHSALKP